MRGGIIPLCTLWNLKKIEQLNLKKIEQLSKNLKKIEQLSIVPDTFPSVGGATHSALHNISELEPCTCPQRTAPPGLPDKLPCDPIPANVPKMREYILNRYASSTFNKCPHHPIPTIPGPPIGIHVDPNATPGIVQRTFAGAPTPSRKGGKGSER